MPATPRILWLGQTQSWSKGRERRVKNSSRKPGIFSLGGQRSSGVTRKALARQSNSKSETHRNCVSIFANVSRLKSHPQRRQRAASIGWVSPCWSRKRRICGPTMFRGLFMFQNQNVSLENSPELKVRNSERFCLPTNGVLVKTPRKHYIRPMTSHLLNRASSKAQMTGFAYPNDGSRHVRLFPNPVSPVTAIRVENPNSRNAAAGAGFCGQQSMKIGHLYRKKGNPERTMAEIRRMLLKKISDRLEKERSSLKLDERKDAGRANNSIENKSALPVQSNDCKIMKFRPAIGRLRPNAIATGSRQRGRFRRGGSKTETSTLSASARVTNSESETQRSWASILDKVARLNSRPRTEQRAAKRSWVSPFWYRSFLTCGPTMFRSNFCFRAMLQKWSLTIEAPNGLIAPILEPFCPARTRETGF